VEGAVSLKYFNRRLKPN